MPVLALLSMSALASLAFVGTLWTGGEMLDAAKAWILLGILGLAPAVYHGVTSTETPSDF